MTEVPPMVKAIASAARQAVMDGLFTSAIHLLSGAKVMIIDISSIPDDSQFEATRSVAHQYGFHEIVLLRRVMIPSGEFLSLHWEDHNCAGRPRLWVARLGTDGLGKWMESPAIQGIRSITGEQREQLACN